MIAKLKERKGLNNKRATKTVIKKNHRLKMDSSLSHLGGGGGVGAYMHFTGTESSYDPFSNIPFSMIM